MTKKSNSKSSSESKKSTSRPRSIIATILGGIVLVIAFIISQITGVDLTGTATQVATTAPTQIIATSPPSSGAVTTISIPQGFGAQKGFWQVFFTAPTGSSRAADYVNGIDGPLAAAIGSVRGTLDIAAFEFNNPVITQAVLAAKARGVTVRMVTDNEHGLEDDDSTIPQLISAGIPVVDDNRSALMHNKFMIMDGSVVWTGSTNYTVNDVYRNNNNMMSLRSRRAVEAYQAEFNEMFEQKQFGPRSPKGNDANFNQDGTPIQILFASEDPVLPAMIAAVGKAQKSIRFMAFSFTDDSLATAIEQRAAAGVSVQGIFERVGSETSSSELTPLFCDGLQVRQDGNKYILHHKVFVIDDMTVVSGSFNFSANATNSNDENLIIIQDSDMAAQYTAEFNRRWAEATAPTGLKCS